MAAGQVVGARMAGVRAGVAARALAIGGHGPTGQGPFDRRPVGQHRAGRIAGRIAGRQ